MIILYVINLMLVILLSIGVLVFVTTLGYQERWKIITGGVLCAAILITGLFLSSRAVIYQKDGEELSKLVHEAAVYLHKKNN